MKKCPSELKSTQFESLLGDTFSLTTENTTIEGRLVESRLSRHVPPEEVEARQDPFSLLFEVDQEVPQTTWSISHDKVGEVQLFMTPVMVPGKMNKGVYFLEAVLA